ncbi:hypothetical protein Tco_1512654 [Tanacetum coccineum]
MNVDNNPTKLSFVMNIDNNATEPAFSEIFLSNISLFEERVAWVEIEGVPCQWRSKNTLCRIASRWGNIINEDELEEGDYHSNRLCVRTKSNLAIFESFRLVYRGKSCWVRAIEIPGWVPDIEDNNEDEQESNVGSLLEDSLGRKDENIADLDKDGELEDIPDFVPETCFDDNQPAKSVNAQPGSNNPRKSSDPFNIYNLLNKAKIAGRKEVTVQSTPTHPPGFTPNGGSKIEEANDGVPENNQLGDQRSQGNENIGETLEFHNKDVASKESSCSGHFKKPNDSHTGGSILQCLEEFVHIGETMGFDMSGCIKNIEAIIQSQGAENVYQ